MRAPHYSRRVDPEIGTSKDRSGILTLPRECLAAVGPDRGLLAWLCGLSVLSGVVESVTLYLIARLATAFADGSRTIDLAVGPISLPDVTLGAVAVAGGVAVVVLVAIGLPVARVAAGLSRRSIVRTRTQLAQAYLASSWEHRSSDPEGHLQELVGEYCLRNERFVQQSATIVTATLNVLALAVVALVITPIGAAIALVSIVAIGTALRPIAHRVRAGSMEMKGINKRIASRVAQTSRVAQEISAFDVDDEVAEWLVDDFRRGGRVVERMRFASRATPLLYQSGTLGLVVVVAGFLLATDVRDVGAFAPMLLLLLRALGYGKQLQTATQSAAEVGPYVGALAAELAALEAAWRRPGGARPDRFTLLELRDVAYEYTAGRPVLTGVDLRIEPGESIGVVGPSGGGKSTLVQLLLQLRQPTSGVILVDGLPLDQVARDRWARLVAFVPQENKLIRASVADNVRFFRAGFTDEEVEVACRAAHLHDEIADLPQGYATEVGPGARDLSGGQRQRLGIARALLGRPELLILDEPTSALDARSEGLIRDTLAEILGHTTLLVVAHRPATLEVCRRVVEVRQGRLREREGTELGAGAFG